jgi:hypothetical protein
VIISSAGFSAGPSNQGVHCISERHPPLKHHPARTRHGEQIRIPGGLGRIAGQDAVLAMIVDELLKVSEEVHCVSRNEFVGLDHRSTDLPQVGLPLASLHSPPLLFQQTCHGAS